MEERAQTTAPGQVTVDADGDGLDDAWETRYGLDPTDATGDNGATGDPDGDGRANIAEQREDSHPRSLFSRHLAEGAGHGYFSTLISIANPEPAQTARVLVRFLNDDSTKTSEFHTIPPRSEIAVDANDVPGVASAFSVVIEADVPVAAQRRMSWDHDRYGAHAETGVPHLSDSWQFAEGATHSGFELFYLLENPHDFGVAVTAQYLLPSPAAPVVRTYEIPPLTRISVWVNQEAPVLRATDVATFWIADAPILVERSMYRGSAAGGFGAGHSASGEASAAPTWYFAEGATGPYFDTFLLVANPNPIATEVECRYLLPDGRVITKLHRVAATSRITVWVDLEDRALANTAVSSIVRTTDGASVLAERAMWWDGPPWREGHVSAGITQPATRWVLAGGETRSQPVRDTYLLVGNVSDRAGAIRVTLLFEDGRPAESRTFAILPESRLNVHVATEFPGVGDARYGAIVDSLGIDPVDIAVEQSVYGDSATGLWSSGTNVHAVATGALFREIDVLALARGSDAFALPTANTNEVPPGTVFDVQIDNPTLASVSIDAATGQLQVVGDAVALGEATVTVGATIPGSQRRTMTFTLRLVRPAPSFATPVVLPTMLAPVVFDLDGDGDLDVLGGINDGTGVMSPRSPADMGLGVLDAAGQIPVNRDHRVADFTGDGIPDLVATIYSEITYTDAVVRFFSGKGDGTFVEDPTFAAKGIRGYGETVVAADFDNDGDVDLFLPHYTFKPGEQHYLLQNDGRGHFTDVADAAGVAMRGWPEAYKVEGAHAADINGDGWIDLYVASHLFINRGGMRFEDVRASVGLPLQFDEGSVLVDWNNDGRLDLVLNDAWTGPVLWQNNGASFERLDLFPNAPYSASYGLNAYDVNNDGLVDVFTSGGWNSDSKLFQNTGATFQRAAIPVIAHWGNDTIAFGDFNRDGRIDVLKRLPGSEPGIGNMEYMLNTTPASGTFSFEVEVVGDHGEKNQFGRVVSISPLSRQDVVYTRIVDGGSAYMAQSQYALLVGTVYDEPHRVSVRFDNGVVQTLVKPGQRVRVARTGAVTLLP